MKKVEIIVQNSTHLAFFSLLKKHISPSGEELKVLMDKETFEIFENFKSRLETVEKHQKILRGSK